MSKMDDECLCLTWNNQGATYQQMLNHLRIENILTDCTLACDGQKFSVHKLVLVTCSDFFKSLLGDVPCQHPIIYLRGIRGQEMQTLIDFMYLGKIDIPQKEVSELVSTAEALQIKGLGVFTQPIQDDSQPQHINQKRKFSSSHASLSPDDVSSQDKTASSHGSCQSICSDKVYPSPKRSHKELSQKRRNIPSEQPTNNVSQVPICEKGDMGKEISAVSPFKSSLNANFSSSSIPLSGELESSHETNHSRYPNILTNIASPMEEPVLTKLAPLHPYVTEYGRSTEIYQSCMEDFSGSRVMENISICEPGNSDGDLEKVTKVKEEALDCTRRSAGEFVEKYPKEHLSLHYEGLNSFTNDDSSQLSIISKIPISQQATYLQDENAENASGSGRPFLCPICRKSFAKVAILKRHHLAHFRPYNCHLCSRSFTRREVLAEHVLEHNGADLRLPCPVCKMTIKRKRNLQAHIKVKHPEYHKQKGDKNEPSC